MKYKTIKQTSGLQKKTTKKLQNDVILTSLSYFSAHTKREELSHQYKKMY